MMKQISAIALAMLTSGFLGVASAGADDTAGQLSRGKTKKAIEAAERRMAEMCYANPLEKRKTSLGDYGPNLVVDPDSPLTGRTGVFKARFNKDFDGKVIVYDEPIKIGTEEEEQPSRVVVGTFKARKLKKLYDFSKLYDRHRMLKKVFEEQVKGLRHTLKIKLPAGHEMPAKAHDHFKATLRVTAVEWDRGELLPRLVIHTELVESKDFGLRKD